MRDLDLADDASRMVSNMLATPVIDKAVPTSVLDVILGFYTSSADSFTFSIEVGGKNCLSLRPNNRKL